MKKKLIQKIVNHIARIKNNPDIYSLSLNSVWTFISILTSQGSTFIATILIARILNTDEFGEFSVILNTVITFGVFAGFGMGITATKHIAEFKNKNKIKTEKVIGICLAIAVIMASLFSITLAALSPTLANNLLANNNLVTSLLISAPLLFLNIVIGVQTSILSGLQAFKAITKINLLTGTSKLVLMISGSLFYDKNGAILGLTFSTFILCILNYKAINKTCSELKITPTPFINSLLEINETKKLLKYSIPAFLSNIMVTPIQWSCLAMLVNQPGGYVEAGIYNAALTFQNIILIFSSTLNAPLITILAKKDKSESGALEKINVLSTWYVGSICALTLIILPEIATITYGEKFTSKHFNDTLLITSFTSLILTYNQGITRSLITKNKMWRGVLSNIIWGLISIFSSLILIEKGSVGLSGSYLIAHIAATLLFVPWYISSNLIPRETLISKEALVIWLISLLAAAIGYSHILLSQRILLLAIILTILSMAFLKIYKLNRSY